MGSGPRRCHSRYRWPDRSKSYVVARRPLPARWVRDSLRRPTAARQTRRSRHRCCTPGSEPHRQRQRWPGVAWPGGPARQPLAPRPRPRTWPSPGPGRTARRPAGACRARPTQCRCGADSRRSPKAASRRSISPASWGASTRAVACQAALPRATSIAPTHATDLSRQLGDMLGGNALRLQSFLAGARRRAIAQDQRRPLRRHRRLIRAPT